MPDLYSTFSEAMGGLWTAFILRLPYLLVGFIAFALFIVVGKIVAGVILRLGTRAGVHGYLNQLVGRLVSFLAWVLGLLVAATVVFPAFRPGDLVAGLGITTVAVGFAFKDILQNFFAGILILYRHPFQVGDEIRSGDYEGVVEAINSRSTRIRTYDGERAIIPNGDVYTNPILVFTAYEKRRIRFKVGIDYEDSIDDARSTILSALEQTEGVLTDPGPWVYVSELSASSVDFTVYFWANSRSPGVLNVKDRAIQSVKEALDDAGIHLPYPHQVVLGKGTVAGGQAP